MSWDSQCIWLVHLSLYTSSPILTTLNFPSGADSVHIPPIFPKHSRLQWMPMVSYCNYPQIFYWGLSMAIGPGVHPFLRANSKYLLLGETLNQWHMRVGSWWVNTQFLCPLTALSNIIHRILEAPVRHWALLVCSDKITLLWLIGPFSNWCFLGSSFWETSFTKIFVSGYAYDKTYFHESINIYNPYSLIRPVVQ